MAWIVLLSILVPAVVRLRCFCFLPPPRKQKTIRRSNNGLQLFPGEKKFDAEWDKTENEYIAAGMSETAVNEMREYDWNDFKKRRISTIHEQSMAASDFDDDDSDESHSSLFFKFIDVMSTNDDISDHHTRYWWIEEIENAKLAKELRNLSDEYLELITLLCMEGCTQIEAAAKMGMTYRTLKRRVAALRKKLEEFL